jgi:hypothetical protein
MGFILDDKGSGPELVAVYRGHAMRSVISLLKVTALGFIEDGRSLAICAAGPLLCLLMWQSLPRYGAFFDWLTRWLGTNGVPMLEGLIVVFCFALVAFCWFRRCFITAPGGIPLSFARYFMAALLYEVLRHASISLLGSVDELLYLAATSHRIIGTLGAMIEIIRACLYWSGLSVTYSALAILSLWSAHLALGRGISIIDMARGLRGYIFAITASISLILILASMLNVALRHSTYAAINAFAVDDPNSARFLILSMVSPISSYILPLLLISFTRALMIKFVPDVAARAAPTQE